MGYALLREGEVAAIDRPARGGDAQEPRREPYRPDRSSVIAWRTVAASAR